MKTKYKFISFEKADFAEVPKGKPVWNLRNNRSEGLLGKIFWYSVWGQYCFYPEFDTIFNDTCLADIQHFIGQLKEGKP